MYVRVHGGGELCMYFMFMRRGRGQDLMKVERTYMSRVKKGEGRVQYARWDQRSEMRPGLNEGVQEEGNAV